MPRGGEAGQTTEDVQRRVDELGWWYHHFELPNGVWTGTGEPPAYDPVERWKLFEPHLPDDLEGKSVLDVGGNSGYFSLRMKQRGAGRCVMVEPVVEFVDQATFVFEQFGVEVEVVCEDVHAYCLTTDERFDYVLFLGLFYHLKYPVLVLDRLAEMTKELIFFNSHIEGIPPQPPAVDEAASSALDRMRRSVARRLDPGQGAVAREAQTWTATSSSRLHSLGCRSSRAPIAATSRTGGSRTTRRSSRSLGARASRSSLARIRRRSSPNRSGISERPATASSSSRATARPKAARSSRASSTRSPSGSGARRP